MEYHPQDYDRLYRDSRGPRPLRSFLRFWGAVVVAVLIVYGIAYALLSLQRDEPQKPSEPQAEKLAMHRAFVIACDATLSSRGAGEKWTSPSCYVRGNK